MFVFDTTNLKMAINSTNLKQLAAILNSIHFFYLWLILVAYDAFIVMCGVTIMGHVSAILIIQQQHIPRPTTNHGPVRDTPTSRGVPEIIIDRTRISLLLRVVRQANYRPRWLHNVVLVCTCGNKLYSMWPLIGWADTPVSHSSDRPPVSLPINPWRRYCAARQRW